MVHIDLCFLCRILLHTLHGLFHVFSTQLPDVLCPLESITAPAHSAAHLTLSLVLAQVAAGTRKCGLEVLLLDLLLG